VALVSESETSSQGVYGAWFSKLNYRWSKNVRNTTWLKSHPVSEVVLVLLRPCSSLIRSQSHSFIIGYRDHHRLRFYKPLHQDGWHRTRLQAFRRVQTW